MSKKEKTEKTEKTVVYEPQPIRPCAKRARINIKVLKHVRQGVLCVDSAQKVCWDPVFRVFTPYSSGQQVKRCIIQLMCTVIGVLLSPITFWSKITDKGVDKIGEHQIWSSCNPKYVNELVGGHMKTRKRGAGDAFGIGTKKRRGPVSFSALTVLHALLSVVFDECVTFDRSGIPGNIVHVVDADENEIPAEEVKKFCDNFEVNIPARHFVKPQKRMGGLFVHTVIIDQNALFTVQLDEREPSIDDCVRDELISLGWLQTVNDKGKCLVAPKSVRDQVIPALAHAIINWTVDSNQSRSSTEFQTVAVAMSKTSPKVWNSISAVVSKADDGKSMATPVLRKYDGVDLFVDDSASQFFFEAETDEDALLKAEARIIEMLNDFDYENQMV